MYVKSIKKAMFLVIAEVYWNKNFSDILGSILFELVIV